eukprot:TRINITY_DN82048_c0_g1_i2.p1 TRINITY_DN82048_c0_g1~~TRINITY_DN82048_c0_g1_i2.p1  ORF type:complete len:252 (+),score=7.54 TRINITY_DN82048_c0_g1_i2:229-984(+)
MKCSGIVAFLVLVFDSGLAIEPPVVVGPFTYRRNCACIKGVSNGCYSSLWAAFNRMRKHRTGIHDETTIYVEGICIGSPFTPAQRYRELRGLVRLVKKPGSKGPSVIFFRSVVALRVVHLLYIGPGIVLQTPRQFRKVAVDELFIRLSHVRIYVGRRLKKGTGSSRLKVEKARFHGRISILLEQLGELIADRSVFSGRPRIRVSEFVNQQRLSTRIRPLYITLRNSTFVRDFEKLDVNTTCLLYTSPSPRD